MFKAFYIWRVWALRTKWNMLYSDFWHLQQLLSFFSNLRDAHWETMCWIKYCFFYREVFFTFLGCQVSIRFICWTRIALWWNRIKINSNFIWIWTKLHTHSEICPLILTVLFLVKSMTMLTPYLKHLWIRLKQTNQQTDKRTGVKTIPPWPRQ